MLADAGELNQLINFFKSFENPAAEIYVFEFPDLYIFCINYTLLFVYTLVFLLDWWTYINLALSELFQTHINNHSLSY